MYLISIKHLIDKPIKYNCAQQMYLTTGSNDIVCGLVYGEKSNYCLMFNSDTTDIKSQVADR